MSINNVSELGSFVQKNESLNTNSKNNSETNSAGSNIARNIAQNKDVDKVETGTKLSVLEGRTKIDVNETAARNKEEKQKESQIDTSAVNNAIDLINRKIMLKSTNLVFEFDDLGDPPIVKVVDKDNGEVIREIPPKEMQEIAKAMGEIADNIGNSSGILFDSKI